MTAVEWLFKKLWDEPKDKFTWYALRQKAIQMEKEQIIQFGKKIADHWGMTEVPLEYIEQYYNETFKSE